MGTVCQPHSRNFLNDSNENAMRNGLNSVARIQVHSTVVCNLLKRLAPGAGVEPAPSYEERILRTLERVPRSLTKRYEPGFTRLLVVKVSLRLATYQHVRPPSWPHLYVLSCLVSVVKSWSVRLYIVTNIAEAAAAIITAVAQPSHLGSGGFIRSQSLRVLQSTSSNACQKKR